MAGSLDESLLKQFFKSYPSQSLSTDAKFWGMPDLPTYPTIHVSGDVNLTLNGETERFSEGAFVFQKHDGSLASLPTKSAWGGGITVEGGPVRSVTTDRYSYKSEGNMANLTLDEQAGQLRLAMPDGRYGASFTYPAPTAKDLVAAAESKGLVMQARSGDKIIEGFFVDGKGGVMPSNIEAFHDGINLKGGEFLSIYRDSNGEASRLFAYKPYTAKEMEQATRFGTVSAPGNDVTLLKTLDGEPLNAQSSPRLNVESDKAIVPRAYQPVTFDMQALREQYVTESVREAQFGQRLAQEFPILAKANETFDEAKIREDAAKLFDERSGTVIGQRKLFAETGEKLLSNNKRALMYAEKDGVALDKSALSELKLSSILKPETTALAAEGGLLGGAATAAEGSLGKTLLRGGAILGVTILGTVAAIKGAEYLMNRKPEADSTPSLKLPDISIQNDGNIKVQGMRDDLYKQHVDGLLQKTSSDSSDKRQETLLERPRG